MLTNLTVSPAKSKTLVTFTVPEDFGLVLGVVPLFAEVD